MITLALFPIRLAISQDLVATYEALSPWLTGYLAARLEAHAQLHAQQLMEALPEVEAAVGFHHPEVLAQVIAGAAHSHGTGWGLACELDIDDDLRFSALLVGQDGEVLLRWQRQGPQYQVLELVHGCAAAVLAALDITPAARELAALDDAPTRSWPAVCALAMAAATDMSHGEEFVDHKLSCLESARANDPDFSDAFVDSARTLRQLGRTASAYALIKDFLLTHDDPPSPLRREAAACAIAVGDEAEAATLLSDLLARDPFDALAWQAQADLLLRQQKPEEAIFCLHEALGHLPKHPDLSLALIEILLQHQQPTRALTALDTHTQRHGHDLQTWRLYTRAHIQSGNPDAVESSLHHILALSPSDLDATLALAQLSLSTQRPAQACCTLLAALARTPKDPSIRSDLAFALTVIDDFDAARALLSDTEHLNHTDPSQRTSLGWIAAVEVALCLQPVHEVDAVFEALRESKVFIDDIQWWLWGVEHLLRCLDLDGAVTLCRQRLGQNPAAISSTDPLTSAATSDKKSLLARLDLLSRRLIKHPPPDPAPPTPDTDKNPDDVQTDSYAARLQAMLSIFRHWLEPSTAHLLSAALTQHQQGRSDAAVMWLQRAVERVPCDFAALGLGVMICCECDQPQAARGLIRCIPPEALQTPTAPAAVDVVEAWLALRTQDNEALIFSLIRLLSRQDLSQARVGLLVDAISATPDAHPLVLDVLRASHPAPTPDGDYLRARLFYVCQDPEQAASLLMPLITATPPHCEALTLAGLIAEQTGAPDAAVSYWEAAIAAHPDTATDALTMLGAHYLKRNQTLTAIHHLERCLSLNPSDAYVAQALRAAIATALSPQDLEDSEG